MKGLTERLASFLDEVLRCIHIPPMPVKSGAYDRAVSETDQLSNKNNAHIAYY
jgi:hypothetical protein